MFKRWGLFLLTNLAIMLMINIILSVFNVQPYLTQYGMNYTNLMIYCAIWGLVGSFASLLMSKFMAKRFMGVQVVEANGQFSGLVNTVHRLAKSAGLPKMPEVGVYESPEVNAFATGPSKSNSLVAVSTGLLNGMTEDELEGVLGHEIAHIANGDMVTMTLLQGVVNAFVLFFAKVATFAISQAMKDDEGRGGLGFMVHIIVEIAFQMVFGIIGMFITSWFSRIREYSADLGGAQLAGREKMIAALKRLQQQYEGGGHFDNKEDSLNAFKISSKEVGLRAMLSTHPRLDERIRRLEMNIK
ncbi:MAG: heat shock protein HtpX [Bacteriovoracaceae bacterium]|jgi:heat shock protein HtpX